MRGCIVIVSHRHSKRTSKLKWIHELPKYNLDYVIVTADPSIYDSVYNETEHTVTLPCADNYKGLPFKIKSAFNFVENTFHPSFVCKIDDDVLVDVARLAKWCSESHQIYDYAGQLVYAYDTIYCGGPLYYISRKSLISLQNMDATFNESEDVCVGHWLKNTFPELIMHCIPLYTDFIEEKDIRIAYHDRDKHLI